MNVDELFRRKRDEILRVAQRHGAYNVRVFGSVARREAGPDSDVDLLVDVGRHRTPFFPGGLVVDLEDLLGCQVEIVSQDALHECIRERVLAEAVPL